jgi:hypothetical protein
MNATMEHADEEGWDHTEPADIAKMAKHFYDQGAAGVRGLSDDINARKA